MQNVFQMLFFLFPSFSLLHSVFGRTGKTFFSVFRQLLLQKRVPSTGSILWTHWQIAVYIFKFSIWENDMSCALEIHSNNIFKRKMWNLVFQPLKTLNIHYYSVYGHQTWHNVNLPYWAPSGTLKGSFLLSHMALKPWGLGGSHGGISTATYL